MPAPNGVLFKNVSEVKLSEQMYQACAKFRISKLASIQFMNWNLNWIDSAPQEVEFELEWSGIKFMAIQRNTTQRNAFWLSQFVQMHM